MLETEPEIGTMLARADAAMYTSKRAGGRSFLTVG
jgi:GGDEF domain-containing protein